MKVPHMPWICDRAGSPDGSRLSAASGVAFRLADNVGTPEG